MISVMQGFLTLFAEKTRLSALLIPELTANAVFLAVVGVCLVLLGILLYRLVSAVLLFEITTIFLCTVMVDCEWRSVVTAFTILGCLIGGFSYNWKLLDAAGIAALVSGILLWRVQPMIWGALGVALAGGLVTWLFPLVGITLFTAAAGSTLLMELNPGVITPILALGLTCLGTALQLLLFGRKQKLFVSTMPEKLRVWLQDKKEAKGR